MSQQSLPKGNADEQWENKLIGQLAFIKKHSRYPLNKKTLAPSFLIITALIIFSRVMFGAWFTFHSGGNIYITIITLSIILLTIIFSISRYIATLKFISIATPHFNADNQKLLKHFMESEHLAFYRMPNAPEVFQIASKSIYSNKDVREVMVFIADDKRILVNSHFSGQGFTINPPSKHYRHMARQLKQWLEKHQYDGNTAIISVNK